MKKACFVAKHGDESLHIFKCYRLRTESGPKISSVCVKVFEEMVTFFLSLSLSLFLQRERCRWGAGNFETELEKVRRRVQVGLKSRLERIPVMHATLLRPFLFWPLDSGASFHRGQREITKIRGSREWKGGSSNDIAWG